MKNKFKAVYLCILANILVISMKGQFSPINFSPNFGNTNPNVIGIGIGSWPNFGATNSRLQVSNFFCANPNGPLNGLMFRTDGNQNFNNMWQLFTGPNAGAVNEKGRIFTSPFLISTQFAGVITGLPAVANSNFNHLAIFAPQGDVVIAAHGVNPLLGSQVSERMRITGYTAPLPSGPQEVTRVSISENGNQIVTPLSLLHIGHPWASLNTGPHRDWMDIGTYYHQQTDGMYVGLKFIDSDKNEGIISFGNNPSSNLANGDRMRFLFVGAPGNGTSTTNQGLEFMHFYTSDGTNPRIAIGDFQTQGLNGDPNNTVEILSSPTSPYWGWGAGNGSSTSGLRFTDLTSGSIVVANTINGVDATKVLTVDQRGDVVLTTPVSQVGADNGCSTNGPTGSKVHLGQSAVGGSGGQLLDDRDIPLNNKNLIFSGTPDNFPGKVGFGIVGGINSANLLSLRPSPITMQVNGSLSIFDGTGNTSVFFGEEQHPASAGTLGEWGIQYTASTPSGTGGLNFWKPFGSFGYNFGNKFLYLCDNGNVGVGATAANPPGNALEITSYPFPLSPQPAGLRFTNLTSSATPVTNPGTGVLAVDGNGDVIYVDAAAGGFGGVCGTNPVGLNNSWEIPLNNKNYIFSGQGTTNNRVGIGTTCSPTAKLEVLQSSTNANSLGVRSINTDKDGVALRAESTGSVSGPFKKVAGWFESTPFFTANDQVAIFVPSTKGIVSIGFASPNLFTSGILNINGSGFTSGGTWQTSDSALKHNILAMENSLDKIIHLQPVTFEWDTVRDTLMSGIHAGFIAEQVNNVIPQVVRPVSGDLKAISYTELVPYVVKGMQQQQLSIDSLRNAPPGSVAAGNGLSVNSGTLELGGNLSHATQVSAGQNNFELFDNSYANISLGNNPAVYPTTTGGGAGGANIAIGHQNSFTNQNAIALGSNNSAGYFSTVIGTGNDASNAAVSIAMGSGVKLENTGGSNITTATGIGEGMHNYASHSIVMGQQVAVPPGGSGVFIGSHFTTAAVTDMETYIANNPGASYSQIDNDAQNSQGGLSPSIIPGVVVTNANRVGVGILSPQSKLDVYGSINSNGFPVTSDSTLKTNIRVLPNGALAKINALRPVTYNWINKVDTFMYGTQYGFTAQQVETVIPDLVKTTSDNHKHLNYNGLISLLTKALQEQQAQIDSMKTALNSCCNNGNHYGNSRSTSSIDVELSDADAVVLNQNVPNPFAEQTTISYNIPKNASAAMILFYDINGRQIKSVDITKKGKGQLNVFANDLSSGVYSYTLVVDGKIFETKKMIKQ